MKAIRVDKTGEPEVLVIKEVTDPKPGAGEILIRLHAVGVNPVETYIRSGSYGVVATPYTPGTDGAGVVEAVGPDVTRFRVGQRVYTAGTLSGSYAEKTLCRENQVHPLPEHVSFAQGASMHVPYATAYRALFQRGAAKAGETVLIHGGSGGVGLAAIQLAHEAKLRVFATAGSGRGLELAAAEGADETFDHKAPGYLEEISKAARGKGVDLILEMAAHVNLAKDLTVLAKQGRVVVIGNRGTIEINPRDLMSRDASIHGLSLWNITDAESLAIHAALVAGLEKKTLRPVVHAELPLAQAAKAHRQILEPGAQGKIILIP